MKKLLFVFFFLLSSAVPTFGAAPVCLFQDNLSGPASGGEGGNGTYIVLRGRNFGATQGTSTVTINGQEPAQYFNWDAAEVTGNYETIGLQVAGGTTGTGAIVVTTADGSCQYSTAIITGLSISSGVATFTYTGPQPAAGQLFYIQGLTSEPGRPLNARSYTVNSAGLTSGQFEISVPNAPNASSTSDYGTAGNGGFTVTSGKLYFVDSNTDKSTPGTCAAMKSANSYRSPWGLTNVQNVDTFVKSDRSYNFLQQRTPFTYYNCVTAGDTLVFLNGVDFPYGDGTSEHTSLFMGGPNGSAGNPITFMARPGATVTFGGPDTVNYGSRGGTATYLNFYDLNFIGSAMSGTALEPITSNNNGPHMRLVGNTAQCPDCFGQATDLGGGWDTAVETNTAPTGLVLYGNWVYNAGCLSPGGVSNKEYHFIYINGNGADVGWNKVGGTGSTAGCAQNGIQMNYYADNSIGYGNFSIHDNDVSYTNGAGINMATIDPSQGPINIYNNIVHHTGLQPASDGGSFFSCMAFPGYSPSAGAGTVNVFNNTCWDTSYELHASNVYSGTSCAIYTSNLRQRNLTVNLVNNIIAQPAYTYTGSRNQNVYLCGSGTSELTGSKNIFYSASTPGSTSPASKLTSLAVPTNPVFVKAVDGPLTNYQLQSTSHAIGAGSTSLRSMMDFGGAMRPIPPAIGAFEYDSTSSSGQITVDATPNPATIEEPVTLTATVTQTGSSIPTGTVDFLNGSTSLGKASLNGEGTAAVVVSSLTTGAYEVVASYSGDANYPARESGEFSLEVQSATTTSLVASPNPVAAGQALVLTATVDGSGEASSTGTVSFMNGATLLGTGTLNSSGEATLSTTALSAGKYTLTAQYAGDASYLASTSAAVSVTVTGGSLSTTTTLVANPNQVIAGATLTLTATVKGSSSAKPTGTVSFMNGSTLLGTVSLNSAGVATLSTTSLAAGTYNLTAKYTDAPTFLASTSASVTVTVSGNAQATTTTLVANPNPITVGNALTLTATVKGSGSATPTGTVNFMSGSTLLGNGSLNSSGVATLSSKSLAAGTHSLTVKYMGNLRSLASTSSAVSVTVRTQTTTTSVKASANTITAGQALTLTATVKGGDNSLPTGSVKFMNGSTFLGTETLNSSGVATLSTKSLADGSHNLTAEYAGNAGYLSSKSGTVSVTVTTPQTSTVTSLAASSSAVTTGEALVLSASVDAHSKSKPEGKVLFLNGSTVLGSADVNSSGLAKLSTASLPVGKHSLTARYSGGSSFLSSASPAVSVLVKAQATTTSLLVSAGTLPAGEALALTATIKGKSTILLAGTVTFLNGSSSLGTATLDSSGVAKLSTTSLTVGTHNLTAQYTGDTSSLTSKSAVVDVRVTAKSKSTSTSVAASTSAVTVGDPVGLTATVKTDGATKPTGTVTFLNGSAVLGTATLNSSGVAKLSSTSLPIGQHELTARFSGSSIFLPSASSAVSVTVNAEPPTIVRGFLLNTTGSTQSETKQRSGTALCTLPVPASGSQAGATVTYLSEGGSCGQGPASR